MINFTKMHGLGNDYIFINCIDEKNKIDNIESATRYLCERNFGIGADGVILINKSDKADFKMNIYNADGTEAQMCGNGIRCFVKYVYDNKLTEKTHITVETLAGIKNAYIRGSRMNKNIDEIIVDMGCPIFDEKLIPVNVDKSYEYGEKEETTLDSDKIVKLDLKIFDNNITAYCVSMGNPHAIVFTNDLNSIDVNKIGRMLENDKHFPERTNVEFVKVTGVSSIKMRVWERGTGETFACGTGACAAVAICYRLGLVRRNVRVSLKGGDLNITWEAGSNTIYMSGIATKVFDGYIEIEQI